MGTPAAGRSVAAVAASTPSAARTATALYAALAEIEADTHLHVHKENNVLFPAVLATEAALAHGAS